MAEGINLLKSEFGMVLVGVLGKLLKVSLVSLLKISRYVGSTVLPEKKHIIPTGNNFSSYHTVKSTLIRIKLLAKHKSVT
jgi:hypothetical protein